MAETPRPRNVVGVGASAGGVEARNSFTAELPATLPCAILVVLHMPAAAPACCRGSWIATAPCRRSPPPPGPGWKHGRIYVAAPDHHLLVDDGRIVLTEGPTENGHRPAINALFPAIPQNAIDAGLVDHQAPAAEIGVLLERPTGQSPGRHLSQAGCGT
ncbi:hypothetical protein MNVM_29910 [Mycobacterium novum]|uniref:protein-glutamate methylesterase n=1 Tax=Mycobacterium novum TaxID=2492438 RepID=A0A7I7JPZ1_9MYCO|nr:chemotaxis protein CheB [Mycobacterium novum]BBX13910.1 hypothetical protein MNVM_29910 [Mycobacterium novum]